ncbi:MAG: hypothetical protein WC497_01460 [Patescibacteria group bacterium]
MLKESVYVKIETAVPVAEAERIRKALGDAGAGKVGNYSHCSGSWISIGRFTPLAGAKPAIGVIGTHEEVNEEIIQVLCHKDKVKDVVAALKKAHPYEEPPIDIIPRYEV